MKPSEAKGYIWKYLSDRKQHARYKRDVITRFFKKFGMLEDYSLKEVQDFLEQEKL